jgi:small subunit ribosomal protein S18
LLKAAEDTAAAAAAAPGDVAPVAPRTPHGAEPAAEPGLPVDYCIFCYHGTRLLSEENTALLSRFVGDRGAILPRRFTKCCAKHQRALAATVKRARSLNLVPVHAKLHPLARFSSLRPPRPAALPADAPTPALVRPAGDALLAERAAAQAAEMRRDFGGAA